MLTRVLNVLFTIPTGSQIFSVGWFLTLLASLSKVYKRSMVYRMICRTHWQPSKNECPNRALIPCADCALFGIKMLSTVNNSRKFQYFLFCYSLSLHSSNTCYIYPYSFLTYIPIWRNLNIYTTYIITAYHMWEW